MKVSTNPMTPEPIGAENADEGEYLYYPVTCTPEGHSNPTPEGTNRHTTTDGYRRSSYSPISKIQAGQENEMPYIPFLTNRVFNIEIPNQDRREAYDILYSKELNPHRLGIKRIYPPHHLTNAVYERLMQLGQYRSDSAEKGLPPNWDQKPKEIIPNDVLQNGSSRGQAAAPATTSQSKQQPGQQKYPKPQSGPNSNHSPHQRRKSTQSLQQRSDSNQKNSPPSPNSGYNQKSSEPTSQQRNNKGENKEKEKELEKDKDKVKPLSNSEPPEVQNSRKISNQRINNSKDIQLEEPNNLAQSDVILAPDKTAPVAKPPLAKTASNTSVPAVVPPPVAPNLDIAVVAPKVILPAPKPKPPVQVANTATSPPPRSMNSSSNQPHFFIDLNKLASTHNINSRQNANESICILKSKEDSMLDDIHTRINVLEEQLYRNISKRRAKDNQKN